jgi:hypothetical protein
MFNANPAEKRPRRETLADAAKTIGQTIATAMTPTPNSASTSRQVEERNTPVVYLTNSYIQVQFLSF